ncbi:MobH family relaxase [Hahella ganghwensis]|uniref:MobH family relaxase n=1 Tax=Hahella ganghwensis TaxID=286420 RepID=UPI000523F3F9|nr:MobH family relaxase [Hahella ganghwensis]
MIKLFRRANLRQSQTDNLRIDAINEKKIPVLGPHAIFQLVGAATRLSAIRALTGISDAHYQLLYQPAIEAFASQCQLVPASATHHHCGLGGLVIHTLEVVELALRMRRGKQLPLQADPEQIADEEHQWTYGIFAAALLHDMGKTISSTSLKLDTGVLWNPLHHPIQETGASSYSVHFHRPNYSLQQRSSTLFTTNILPAAGLHWISSNSDLMHQLINWLYGHVYEYGVIGDIVREADMTSVARNLGASGKRLSNAPSIPLIEKLMTALRQLIETDQLRVNRNGAAIWIKGEYAYTVCGVVAKKVITQCNDIGITDIPHDNSRLFDTWQEHGYALSTSNGNAIWFVKVANKSRDETETYSHFLTVLKFEVRKLFHPSRRPMDFDGTIEELDETEFRRAQLLQNEEAMGVAHQDDSNPITETNEVVPNSEEQSTRVAANSDTTASEPIPASTGDNEEKEDVTSKVNPPPLPSIYDGNLLNHFLSWIREKLRTGKMLVNQKSAMIHVVKEGTLLVSPRLFSRYVDEYQLDQTLDIKDGEKTSQEDLTKRAYTIVQKRLEKSRLNIKAANRMNIHIYAINGQNKKSKIKGFLVSSDLIFPDVDTRPQPNEILENTTGIYSK